MNANEPKGGKLQNGGERQMSPTLIVKNFSCLKDIDVTFRRMAVFIGEQASGKSVTCKLFYFFTQVLRTVLRTSVMKNETFLQFKKAYDQEFRLIFPETAWSSDSFRIIWTVGANRIEVTHKRGNKRLTMSFFGYEIFYSNVCSHWQAIGERINRPNRRDGTSFEHRMAFDGWLSQQFSGILNTPSVTYVPAGRSFFSTIQDTVFTLLSDNIGIDYFLKEFGRQFEALHYRSIRARAETPSLREMGRKILHGQYHFDGKDQWIISDEKHRVRLADASSGQQESLPLLLVLMDAMKWSADVKFCTVAEEPEAHLYPTAQQSVIEMIGYALRQVPARSFVITTHSPFILCCLNNQIRRSPGLARDFSSYHIHDGESEDIFSREDELIEASRFDDISSDIANDIH